LIGREEEEGEEKKRKKTQWVTNRDGEVQILGS
jgi:hypothetical protein